jgi:hypothetical protein
MDTALFERRADFPLRSKFVVASFPKIEMLAKYPDLADQLPSLGEALKNNVGISYTQWEAWLALYHGKLLLTAKAEETAVRGPNTPRRRSSRAAQVQHLARLEAVRRYPGCAFASPADLAKHIAYTAILDLLVKDYAEAEARARAVAEGFIREMAKRVAGDRNLDFDGMKQAVRNAIEIYETEIAGAQTQTNIDTIVDQALQRAKSASIRSIVINRYQHASRLSIHF